MNTDNESMLAFQCEACGKRLRAKQQMSGRQFSCPKCAASVTVPEIPSAPKQPKSSERPTSTGADPGHDSPQPQAAPLSLSTPAISDLDDRQQAADSIRAEKNRQREQALTKAANRRAEAAELKRAGELVQPIQGTPQLDPNGLIPFDSDDELAKKKSNQESNPPGRNSSKDGSAEKSPTQPRRSDSQPASPTKRRRASSNSASSQEAVSSSTPPASIFDGELPDLDALHADVQSVAETPLEKTTDSKQARKSSPNKSGSGKSSRVKRGGSQSGAALSKGRQAKQPAATPSPAKPSPPTDDLGDIDDLVPELEKPVDLPPLMDNEALENAQYRVTCKVCGTSQYVSPSAKGMKIKCPDCFTDFKAPPPPAGWKPKPVAKRSVPVSDEIGLVPDVQKYDLDASDQKKKQRTQQILDKAADEVASEEDERLYETDFDTAGFMQSTFGFLRDPLTLAQVMVYGLVFALLFAMAQFSFNDTESQFGRGLLLITVLVLPLIGLLFALPMLSGGLALIEAAANKERRVQEIPAFNIFDNFADLIVVFVALLLAIIPGYLIGSAFSGEDMSFFKIAGMVLGGFALFPIFLLSMLDHGSMFNPISASVLRSLREATESWGAYFLKTLAASFVMLVIWLVLLGRSPAMSGIAGFLLPLLFFFTCQQVGTLADGIADHLSFEFQPSEDDDEQDADAGLA